MARRPALHLLAADPLGLFAGSDGHIAGAERAAAGGKRLLDRALLEPANCSRRSASPGGLKSSARAPSGIVKPLTFGDRGERAGASADHRQR